MGILGNHSKWSLEVMVDLVDILVDGAMVKELMDPVVPRVLYDQTHHHLYTQHVPRTSVEMGDVIMM